MAGLYPAKHRTSDPILTLVTYPPDFENLHKQSEKCPILKEMEKQYMNVTEYIEALKSMQDFEKRLQSVFNYDKVNAKQGHTNETAAPKESKKEGGKNNKKEHELVGIKSGFTSLQARLCHGMPLPSVNGEPLFRDDEMQKLAKFVDFEAALKNGDAGPVSLKAAQMTSRGMLEEVMDRIQRPPQHKFFLYSAHDTTILNLLGALDAENKSWPPYASNMIFEVWQQADEVFLRIIYNGDIVKVKKNWCDFRRCSMNRFIDFFRPILELDMERECKGGSSSHPTKVSD
jgi:hypothetical protein